MKALLACAVVMGTCTMAQAHALKNLTTQDDCVFAETSGTVVSRELTSSGELHGFTFRDQYGDGYINVDPPRNRKTRQALVKVVTPGAKLKVGAFGCGAGAKIQVLSSVKW